MTGRGNFLARGLLAVLCISALAAPARAWPDRPVRVFTSLPANTTVDLVARLVHEGIRVAVLGPAGHPGVGVAQRHHAINPKDFRRSFKFASPVDYHRICIEALVTRPPALAIEAECPVGAGDQDLPHAPIAIKRLDAAGEERLVVRVSMNAQQSQWTGRHGHRAYGARPAGPP